MLITAGILVLADAGLTLVWQEPLAAAYGSLEQGKAEGARLVVGGVWPTRVPPAVGPGVEPLPVLGFFERRMRLGLVKQGFVRELVAELACRARRLQAAGCPPGEQVLDVPPVGTVVARPER